MDILHLTLVIDYRSRIRDQQVQVLLLDAEPSGHQQADTWHQAKMDVQPILHALILNHTTVTKNHIKL